MRLSDRRIMAKWGAGEGTQIASRYAELAFFGVATTARRGIFVRSAAPTPQPKNAKVRILGAGTSDATSTESSWTAEPLGETAEGRVARAQTKRQIPSAGVVARPHERFLPRFASDFRRQTGAFGCNLGVLRSWRSPRFYGLSMVRQGGATGAGVVATTKNAKFCVSATPICVQKTI